MDSLKSIGLNSYERRLWVALLSRGVSTAGELSEIANVPRSRTYDILESLADKGFVMIQPSKPLKYVAINPVEALDRARSKLQEDYQRKDTRMQELKKSDEISELSNVFSSGMNIVSPEEIAGTLKGKTSLMRQLDSLLSSAENTIEVSTNDIKDFTQSHSRQLAKAKRRGVNIKITAPLKGLDEQTLEDMRQIAEIKHSDDLGRFFIADSKNVLMALTDNKEVHDTQDVAFWSQSKHAAEGLSKLFRKHWECLENNQIKRQL